jgi:predicted nicotinamide N-methyase
MASPKPQTEELEVQWIESKWLQQQEGENTREADEEDIPAVGDLFADPDPLESFRFDWDTLEGKHIAIELTGHKAELGQTLNSTGLTLWRASELLCEYLVKHPEWVATKDVLELGSGLGLVGLLVHHLGAARTTLTDGDTDTLSNLRENVQRNGADTDCGRHILCRQLVWGEKLESFQTSYGSFDTIVGSDIIYVEQILDPLWTTVDLLLRPAGTFLLSYARRNVSIDLVLRKATEYGFEWTTPEMSEGVFVFVRTSI